MNFDLDQALAAWRTAVIARDAPETEDLAELEAGLLDRYDEFLLRGHAPAAAFAAARERTGHTPPAAASTRSLLGNYLKLAVRHLRGRRTYQVTNYATLTIGIATAALALLYLSYETSYDGQFPAADRKFRAGMVVRAQGYSLIGYDRYGATTAAGQQRQIRGIAAVAGVRSAVQFATFPEPILATGNARELPVPDRLETNTPAEFLDYFGVALLAGDPAALAEAPDRVLLTASLAGRYFGPDWRQASVVGQRLRVDTLVYTIAGVVADPPPNTHFTYSLIAHRAKIGYWGARTYLEIEPGVDPQDVQQRMEASIGGINPRLASSELFGGMLLQPLRSIHLHSDLLYELKPPGDARYLYILAIIAAVILLLTISNYTNLSIVMHAGRAREIGLRKVFGASEGQVAGQFLLEAVGLSLLTVPPVLLALWWVIPRFNLLMGVALSRNFLTHPGLLLLLLGLTIAIGLLAGAYPAWVLARTRVQGLFRASGAPRAGSRLTTRKAIITLQFVLLIGLCSLTLFVNRQLHYIQDKDLGYRKENILYVQINADSSRLRAFRYEVLRIPGVTDVGSGTPMGQSPFNQTTYQLQGTGEVYDDAHNISLDYRALQQLGIQTSVPDFVADPDAAPDRLILINRTLADRLANRFQLTETELIGRTLIQEPEYVDEDTGQTGFPYPIAGTFQDLHLFSLREAIDPMFLTVYRDPGYVYAASISYTDRSRAEILAAVGESYRAVGFPRPFAPSFLTDNLTELYRDEARIGTLSTYFSLLAFLMATIGLVALTAYLTAVKQKEIGIRKILGASTGDILRRFNLEYVPLLGAAVLLTVPLAWWGISRWLEGFAYRIAVSPWVFVVAVGIVAVITSLAVTVVTVRAARAVPARVLTRNG